MQLIQTVRSEGVLRSHVVIIYEEEEEEMNKGEPATTVATEIVHSILYIHGFLTKNINTKKIYQKVNL